VPHAVFLDGHHGEILEWSDRIASISRASLPRGKVSVDEGLSRFLPAQNACTASARRHGQIASYLNRVRPAFPASGGLATTRSPQKWRSDQAKPRGLVWVAPGQEAKFLAPLPVARFPVSVKSPNAPSRALGVETRRTTGEHSSEKLENISANGGRALSQSPRRRFLRIRRRAEPKSISHNSHLWRRYRRFVHANPCSAIFRKKRASGLREAGLAARTLTLTIRYTRIRHILAANHARACASDTTFSAPFSRSLTRIAKKNEKNSTARHGSK